MPNVTQDYLRQFAGIIDRMQGTGGSPGSVLNQPDWTTVNSPNLNPATQTPWGPGEYNKSLAAGGNPVAFPNVTLGGKPWTGGWGNVSATGQPVAKAIGAGVPLNDQPPIDYYNTFGNPFNPAIDTTSFWFNPGENQFYRGTQDKTITPMGSTAPWAQSPSSTQMGGQSSTFAPSVNPSLAPPAGPAAYSGNPFQDTGGGVNWQGALAGLFDFITKNAAPLYDTGARAASPDSPLAQFVSQLLMNGFPTGLLNQQTNALGQNANMSSQLQQGGFASLMPFLQTMAGNLGDLNQDGLPGNQQVQDEQSQLGGLASSLLGTPGGARDQYGLSSLLQQIMRGPLPNQPETEEMTAGQFGYGQDMQNILKSLIPALQSGTGVGSPLQSQLSNQLGNLISGSGLTPEYARAMRETVFDPSVEAMKGNLNQMGRGAAAPSSGLFQELLRRQERDFNNQLLSQGFNNLQGLMGQAQQAGAQPFTQGINLAGLLQGTGQNAIAQGLQGFTAVPGAVAPFTAQAGGLISDLLSQALQRFTTGGNLNLQNLNTIQNLAMQPYQTGTQNALSTQDRSNQVYSQFMNAILALLQQQQGAGVNAMNPLQQMLNSLMGGAQTDIAADAQRSAARSAAIGSTIGAGVGAIPGIAGLF